MDLERGLACRARCEQPVRELIEMIDQSLRFRGVSGGLLRTTPSLWLGLTVVALAVGLFVAVFGLSLPMFRGIALLSIPFLAIGVISLRMHRSVRKASAGARAGET